MARTYPLYISVGTSKYGGEGVKYGFFEYGWNYPPPKPENLQVTGGPIIVDGTPHFSWTNPTFSWEVAYGDGDPLYYELQISYNDPTFSTIDKDTNEFLSPGKEYTLAPEYELGVEGTYYARIRSTDGYTYSDWSDSLEFVLFLFAAYPPTLDPVTSPANGFTQVLTGTKVAGVYVFVRNNGGEWLQALMPDGVSGTSWTYTIPLSVGENKIEVISAVTTDLSNATSTPVRATIYLLVSTPEVFNVWNCFDEMGLLLTLPRIPGERNRDYRARLLDVHIIPANSTYQGLVYGIARELGIDAYDYLVDANGRRLVDSSGAYIIASESNINSTIQISRLSDLLDPDYSDNLLNSEGNALGTKLVDYADEVYDNNPIFWGNVISDESYFDGVDEESGGYVFLPHQWDPSASGLYDKWQHGGIGDRNDLWVGDPEEVWNVGISGYSWYLPIHTGYFYSVYPSGVLII